MLNFCIKLHNTALRCEQRLDILERSESAKRCESLLNALPAAQNTTYGDNKNQKTQHIDYQIAKINETARNTHIF